MARGRDNSGALLPNPYNETTPPRGGAAQDYDESGAGVYHSWSEVIAMHLSQSGADMQDTPNLRSGAGTMGGPAPGESNPAGFSGTAESKQR